MAQTTASAQFTRLDAAPAPAFDDADAKREGALDTVEAGEAAISDQRGDFRLRKGR